MTRLVAVASFVALLVVAVAVVVDLSPGEPGGGGSAAATPIVPLSTATIVRRTMQSTEEFDGTLGYAGDGVIIGGLNGTYTKLPRVGDILTLGDEIYEVDGALSSYVMYGSRPAWRPLSDESSSGPDIRQLELSLKALGFLEESFEADGNYRQKTVNAVRRWERRTGQERDGDIDPGQVTFLPGDVRITEVIPELGSTARTGGVVARTSGTQLVVVVNLEADRRDILEAGDTVTVELPDGSVSAATVAEIDSVAETLPGATGPTVEVTIELTESATTGNLDGAEVTVNIVRQTRPDVLSVPVDALLALREGGYALEMVAPDGSTDLVGVEVGLFDDAGVEVRGDIEEGETVVVPA